MTYLFIYSNGRKIQVLTLDQSNVHHEKLLEKGCKHTATIDPALFLQDLLNASTPEEAMSKLNELKTGTP